MPVLHDGKLYSWELAYPMGQCSRCGGQLQWSALCVIEEEISLGIWAKCCGQVVTMKPVQGRVEINASP